MPAAAASSGIIQLKPIERETLLIEIQGTAPLIVHAWSKKAREMMLAAQQGKKAPKTLKDPEQDFQDSKYFFADESGEGFPTLGLKAAVVKGGGRVFGKSVKMTELRQNFVFDPDGYGTDGAPLTRITSKPAIPREDMVRVGNGVADIRYRAMYEDWSMILTVKFIPTLIDAASVVALVDAGGTNGIGEWRPEKNGQFGTFQVVGS